VSRGSVVRRHTTVVLIALAIVAGSAGGVVAARLRASPAARPTLPAYHGQSTWAAGARRAPGFALRDQTGRVVSLAALRDTPVLLTFLDSQCTEQCPIDGRELAAVLRSLPAARRPALVVVSVDPVGDTRAGIARATARWGLAGPWRWHWLNGPRAQLAAVWRAYGIEVEPTSNDIVHGLALYLIDRAGDERAGYLFPFLPGFVRSDLGRLAGPAA
jgi:cytochrome oxidase Cu insertion factor (SCO1/SenC/PrrC family)